MDTSMPTERTVRCSSITLPCKCGAPGPSGCPGVGLRWWRPHQALSRAFEPLADAGWPPPLASPVSFRRATQTYKAVRRAIQHSHVWTALADQGLVAVMRVSRVRSCLRPFGSWTSPAGPVMVSAGSFAWGVWTGARRSRVVCRNARFAGAVMSSASWRGTSPAGPDGFRWFVCLIKKVERALRSYYAAGFTNRSSCVRITT